MSAMSEITSWEREIHALDALYNELEKRARAYPAGAYEIEQEQEEVLRQRWAASQRLRELRESLHDDEVTLEATTAPDQESPTPPASSRVSTAISAARATIPITATERQDSEALALLDSPYPEKRRQGACMLQQTEDPDIALPPLLKLLHTDLDVECRMAAADALGRIGDVRAVDALLAALRDGVPQERRMAALALGELGHIAYPEAIPWLENAAQTSRDPEVRSAASIALTNVQNRRPSYRESVLNKPARPCFPAETATRITSREEPTTSISGKQEVGETAIPGRPFILDRIPLRTVAIQVAAGILLGVIMSWASSPEDLRYGMLDRVFILVRTGLIGTLIYALPLRGFSGPGRSGRRIIALAAILGLLVWAGASVIHSLNPLTPGWPPRLWFIAGSALFSGLLFPAASYGLKFRRDLPLLLAGLLLIAWTVTPLHWLALLRFPSTLIAGTFQMASATPLPAPPARSPTPPPKTPAPTVPPGVPSKAQPGLVLDVPANDSLQIERAGSKSLVRYLGINIPTGMMRGAGTAAQVHSALVQGRQVWIEPVISVASGEWAYVWLMDGRLVNEQLIGMGYALPALNPPDVRYQQRFADAAQKARASKAGFWAGGVDVAPYAAVTVDIANLRQLPSTSQPPIGQAKLGAIYAITGCNRQGDWVQIQTAADSRGWIFAELMQSNTPVMELDIVE